MLIGDRDYLALHEINWPKTRFMLFDRSEIHIQAFVDFINGKFMSGHSSSSTFHDFTIFSFYKITNEKSQVQNSKKGHLRLPRFRKFSNFQIIIYEKSIFFKDDSLLFLYVLE